MPKKARQAHIPQQIRRRKPRRGAFGSEAAAAGDSEALPLDLADAATDAGVAEFPRRPAPSAVEPRPHRRLESLTRSRDPAVSLRVVPGQLPTFERAFLVNELKRITITAGSLLALIIVLTFALR